MQSLSFDTYRQALTQGLQTVELDLSSQQEDKLLSYLSLLSKWTQVYNLTAIRTPAEMLSHHLFDTLAVLPLLKKRLQDKPSVRILDVGSGGGLPGIPWAIACPHWNFTLVDTVHKKTAFLTQAKLQLQLSNLEVVTAHVEHLAENHIKEGFTIITSRAFAELADFIHLAGSHLSTDGVMVALKGNYPSQELESIPANWQVNDVVSLTIPQLAAQRHVVFLTPTAH